MSIKVVTQIYQCEEGHNFIILDENFDDIKNIDVDELYCPVCGEAVSTETTRVIQINKVT